MVTINSSRSHKNPSWVSKVPFYDRLSSSISTNNKRKNTNHHNDNKYRRSSFLLFIQRLKIRILTHKSRSVAAFTAIVGLLCFLLPSSYSSSPFLLSHAGNRIRSRTEKFEIPESPYDSMNGNFPKPSVLKEQLRADLKAFSTTGISNRAESKADDRRKNRIHNEKGTGSGDSISSKSVAVYLQVGYSDLWGEMLKCTTNVAKATSSHSIYNKLDIYVSIVSAQRPTKIIGGHEDGDEDASSLPSSSSRRQTQSIVDVDVDSITSSIRNDITFLTDEFQHIDKIQVKHFENRGADVGSFLQMLSRTYEQSTDASAYPPYDIILKMHTKGDDVWRDRALESLCGTNEQVTSILSQFDADKKLDMIAPLGTVFGPATNISDIFPHIVRKYNFVNRSIGSRIMKSALDVLERLTKVFGVGDGSYLARFIRTKKRKPLSLSSSVPGHPTPADAFDAKTISRMNDIHQLMFFDDNGNINHSNQNQMDIAKTIDEEDDMLIAAGTMFWIRYSALHVKELVSILPKVERNFTSGYVENSGIEHAFERLFATEIAMRQRRVAEIAPAPQVVAMYFPQFHHVPENDEFWGEGFTEWTLLKPMDLDNLRKPLPVKEGGLGFYDLMEKESRKAQADMAKSHGVNGFIYYHYWFSGSHAPPNHVVMQQIPEQMLLDGEPNLPFAFSWANEPWTKRWTGVEDKVSGNSEAKTLLSQEYGNEEEWKDHFEYLLPFFKHPNYILVDGKPMFILYRIGHIGSNLKPMVKLWRKLALEAGLPGLHIVNTIGNFRYEDGNTAALEKEVHLDAAFHFWPQLFGSGFTRNGLKADTASANDLTELLDTYPTQYWGAFTGFDRRPRDSGTKAAQWRTVQDFDRGLRCSFQGMAGNRDREIQKNLYFITAWNEWNEQAILEPDSTNGFGYLEAMKISLSEFPISVVSPLEEKAQDQRIRQTLLEYCKKASVE